MSRVSIRNAEPSDLDTLLALERRCFETDRLSRRSLRHWLQVAHRSFSVAELEGRVVGYSLVIFRRGTTLARLYSIAVDPDCRGLGIARRLMAAGERQAEREGRVFLRLEVEVDNGAAIALYEAMGYQPFGIYRHYYENEHDALRMQKCIRSVPPVARSRPIAWIQQTTPFTCGPAALMMALHALSRDYLPDPQDELRLWREATTIFMTSGHGGCHPVGLALAARRRGFDAEVWLNRKTPLFVDGVRDENKKRVVRLVHEDFMEDARKQGVRVRFREFGPDDLVGAFRRQAIPVVLISTYLMDGRKAPHWVTFSGYDDDCIYVHDPDPDPEEQSASGVDSQYLPIARRDFARMSRFGSDQLRTAVIVRQPLPVEGRG